MVKARIWRPYSHDEELAELYRRDRELLAQRAELLSTVRETKELLLNESLYGAFHSIDRQRSNIWDQIRKRKNHLRGVGELSE